MLVLPIPMIPRTALAMILVAVAHAAFARNPTTPTSPSGSADSTARTGTNSQQGPCGVAAPPRPGPRKTGFDAGTEQSTGLGLGAELAPLGMLDLGANQRTRINAIQRELCVKNVDFATRIAASKGELRQLYAAGTRDTAAIDRQYERLFALQRQAIEADIDAFERIKSELTTEQRAALEQYSRGPAGIAPPGAPGPRAGDRKGAGK